MFVGNVIEILPLGRVKYVLTVGQRTDGHPLNIMPHSLVGSATSEYRLEVAVFAWSRGRSFTQKNFTVFT